MKYLIYIIKDTSYRYGDLNKENRYYFHTEKERNDRFLELRKDYIETMKMIEYEPNSFSMSESTKWSYSLEKEEVEYFNYRDDV